MEPQRQTAYQIWISNLLSGNYVRTSGEWEPNYIEVSSLKISRVNIIGHIVDKYVKEDGSYATLSIDDGSGKIPLKAWKEDASFLTSFAIGDLLLVVAKVKDFNNQIYLVPEIVTKLDNPLWAKLRKLELDKNHGQAQTYAPKAVASKPSISEEETFQVIEEKVTNETPSNKRQAILDLIEKLDTNNGADQQLVIGQSGINKEEVQKLLESLLREGEIFEIHPGKLRTTL